MTDEKRIIARFRPQAWIGDNAIDVDDAYDFDITDQVMKMGREEALALEDHTYEADALWRDNPVCLERPHSGPFEVEAEDAIRAFFAE